MKILFVVPSNKSLFGGRGLTAHPHVGVACLSAFLKQKDVEVAVFDEGLGDGLDGFKRLIAEFKPTLIGITIFSYCYDFAYVLIKKIKEITDTPIVAGGPHICAIGKKILKDTEIKFAVKQEGEFTLLELLQQLSCQCPDYNKIKGLIWRDRDNIVENESRPLIEDLDSLPFPDYDVFDINRYICFKYKMLPLITSRGCPFGCNYCSVRLSMGQGFRARSAKNVFSEIKHFYDRGYRSFDINDDCFTLDIKRAEDICDLIITSNLKIRFQLYNGIRVDTVNPLLLEKMRRAGCFFIAYGCEAGTPKVLKAIKKGITLEQVRKAVSWANEAGIRNCVNFIIGHKEETYEDALKTLDFAKSLKTDFVNFYNLLPYPGTESLEWALANAKLLVPMSSYLENISYRDNKPIYETIEFTKEQREEVISLGFDLYRERLLKLRLGRVLGGLIYWLTKWNYFNRIATDFALSNRIGKFIYTALSKKSVMAKR